MTQSNKNDDFDLDALFQEARIGVPTPNPALFDQIIADAQSVLMNLCPRHQNRYQARRGGGNCGSISADGRRSRGWQRQVSLVFGLECRRIYYRRKQSHQIPTLLN